MTTYSISEMSSEFKITPRTLRFYEEKGLLTPSRQGRSRIYNASDRVRLELILRGKRLGFSLEESCDIIDMYDPTGNNLDQLEKVTETVRTKIIQLKQQQRDLKSMLRELKTWEDNYLKAIQGVTNVNSGESAIHSRVNP
ncbi:MAG: MerR family DNA-binding transcriptional regulator [Pseudomonadales bacterium]|nr:MerR family DNA-binding transcriptional regulator [Pseudomonadales bacterium]